MKAAKTSTMIAVSQQLRARRRGDLPWGESGRAGAAPVVITGNSMGELGSLAPVLVFCGLISGVITVIALYVQGEARASGRTARAAQTVAEALNLRFTTDMPESWPKNMPGCSVFEKGLSREAGYYLSGEYRGWPVELFELTSYDRGRNGETNRMDIDLVLVAGLARFLLPSFQLVPLSFGDRLAESISSTNRIVFDGSDAGRRFSREYNLWAHDRRPIESLFDPDLVAYFAERPGWHLWVGDGRAVIWAPRWRGRFWSGSVTGWRSFLDSALDVLDALASRD